MDLGLINPHGVQHAYSGSYNLANADYANAVWFSEAHKRQYYIRKILTNPLEFEKVMVEEVRDIHGRRNILAAKSLNDGRWVLFFQQELADAYSAWNKIKVKAAFLFLLWSGVVAMFTFAISRRMTLQVEEERVEKEKMSEQVVEAGRLASIGELAAGIAHEINNPVAIMVEEVGWIKDLLEDQDPLASKTLAEIERAANQIQTQGGRCKEITRKLLSFARKTDPTDKEIDLNELIREIINLVDQKTRYANVRIETNLTAQTSLTKEA